MACSRCSVHGHDEFHLSLKSDEDNPQDGGGKWNYRFEQFYHPEKYCSDFGLDRDEFQMFDAKFVNNDDPPFKKPSANHWMFT